MSGASCKRPLVWSRRSVSARRRRAWFAAITAAIVLAAVPASRAVVAQDRSSGDAVAEQPERSPEPELAAETPAVAEEALPGPTFGDYILMTTQDGRYVPVPIGARVNEFQQWLKTRERMDDKSPPYNINSIAIEGTADEERAMLTARIKIQIHERSGPDQQAAAWVRVPLRMDESVIRPGFTHSGPGEARPEVGPERLAGLHWRFRGEGLHELTLPIAVPLAEQVSEHRLQLTLPRATASNLKLRVPIRHIDVKQPERSIVSTNPSGDSATEIEVFGLGERLDLRWNPLPDQEVVQTRIRAVTKLTVGPTADARSIWLTAHQTIHAGQGSLQRIRVYMPPEFELQFGELYGGDEQQFSSDDVQDQQRDSEPVRFVDIELKKPTTGAVELRWQLAADFPADGNLDLSGFEVEGARHQSGEITVTTIDGYRVLQRDGVDVSRTGTQTAVPSGQVVSMFRFNRPFRLGLSFQEIPPRVTVEPELFLQLSENHADLTAVFRLDVYLGAVQEVEVPWANRMAEGWVIDPAESAEFVERLEADPQSDAKPVRVRFLKRMNGKFELRLRARRPLAGNGEPFELTLPTVTATNRRPTVLVVADAENVESELTPQQGTIVRPVSSGRQNAIEWPEELPERRAKYLRVDTVAHSFRANVAVQDREVHTDSAVIVELNDNADELEVTQKIAYHVAYEELSQVRLMVPLGLERRVLFFVDEVEEGFEVNPDWTGLVVQSREQARISLLRRGIGGFDIFARYNVELEQEPDSGQPVRVALPLVQSLDAEHSTIRFEFKDRDRIAVTVDDGSWMRQLSMDGASVWMNRGEKAVIPIEINHSTSQASQDYSIRKALIRSQVDVDGRILTTAEYLLQGPVSSVYTSLPAGTAGHAFWWDDQRLDVGQYSAVRSAPGAYVLDVSDTDPSPSHLLRIAYQSRPVAASGWAALHKLDSPRFAENVWVEETVWQLVLPFDRYLFSYPQGLTPKFGWQRDALLWSRKPFGEYAHLDGWLSDQENPDGEESAVLGNAYTFSCFGPAKPIVFESMSQSIAVLVGAGLALAAGFLLLKLTAARTVIAVLMLAFITALIGLWYPAPVQLLVQPAVLGVLLAMVGAMIENIVKRDAAPAILTLPAPSEVLSTPSAASSVDRHAIPQPGPERPTELSPLTASASDSISSSHSGNSG